MKKNRFFTAKELVFRESDGTYYAVSLSFGVFAEGNTAEEALTNLQHATIGYLMMCIKENETEEKIYRGAPKHYIDVCKDFEKEHIKPPQKFAKKRYTSRMSSYSSEGSYVYA